MRKRAPFLTLVALLVLCWQLWSMRPNAPLYLFPSPLMVMRRISELAADNILLPSLGATICRMVIGFCLAVVIGMALGIAMGMRSWLYSSFSALLLGIQALPSAAWVPISLLLFGLHDAGIYFVIVMSSSAAVAMTAANGINGIAPLLIRAARTLGTPPGQMWYRVVLPAALPSVVAALKLGWTLGWHGAVTAELIKSSVGLGFLLHMGRELNDSAQIIGMMLVTILVSVAVDRLFFEPFERVIRQRWGLVEEGR